MSAERETALTNQSCERSRPGLAVMGCVIVAATMATNLVFAAPPITPIAPAHYSFDLGSDKVVAGVVDSDDVLEFAMPDPLVDIPGPGLAFMLPGDDLDALSGPNELFSPSDTFLLLFSVDRLTDGLAPPDDVLVSRMVPYNVFEQAGKCQQAGDQFMSTEMFTRFGIVTPMRGLGGNNVLVRNNYDEGGTDFAANPPTSAKDDGCSMLAEDLVDATGYLKIVPASRSVLRGDPNGGPGGGPTGDDVIQDVFFSATSESPSLPDLSSQFPPSGANILYNEGPFLRSMDFIFANFADLGLVQDDDIDAMIIFDDGVLGVFEGTDQVLFSLAPGSPSLGTIPGASLVGAAADVFSMSPGFANPIVFASAADLGLGAATDNIDALEFRPCTHSLVCAEENGIRRIPGDFDNDGDLEDDDYDSCSACMTGPGGGLNPGCEPCDADQDMDVDLFDLHVFELMFLIY